MERAELEREVERLRAELVRQATWKPPGHYYSPIPDPDEVRARQAELFERRRSEIPGVDLNGERQKELLWALREHYDALPFHEHATPELRYHYENGHYSYGDGIFLFCILLHVRPRRIVEVGSGFSSALMLDVDERFFDRSLELTFIDPDPVRLDAVLRGSDEERVDVRRRPVQDVALDVFEALRAGDVLFIDSTHVAKTGSDVNHLFFEVLPRLAPGVWVHLHDVHYPFEYPLDWVLAGRAWNEAYLLRAFLQYNRAFSIQCIDTLLELYLEEWFRCEMPLCLRDPGGSIWLRREATDGA